MDKKVLSAVVIAIGLTLAGVFIFLGIHQMAFRDRTVTVKGLSTRDVNADYVVWPLDLTVSGNDLKVLYNQVAAVEKTTRAFFSEKGFKTEEMSLGNTTIDDNWNGYYERRPENHYTIHTSFIISTDNVELVLASQGCLSELMARGVILNSYKWNTNYQYNGLNDIKPEMIEEATKNARAVAQKFADDAQCSLGSIRKASQGQFTVTDDDNQPWIKHIRVVSTVDYYLK